MALEKKYGSVKRFGARYGASLKEKFAKIEKEQRKKHDCPYCRKPQVKRVALGIWQCKKCGSKFSGKAYTIGKIKVKEEVKKEKIEQPEEKLEEKEEVKEPKKKEEDKE